jgi:hypothetical protein
VAITFSSVGIRLLNADERAVEELESFGILNSMVHGGSTLFYLSRFAFSRWFMSVVSKCDRVAESMLWDSGKQRRLSVNFRAIIGEGGLEVEFAGNRRMLVI